MLSIKFLLLELNELTSKPPYASKREIIPSPNVFPLECRNRLCEVNIQSRSRCFPSCSGYIFSLSFEAFSIKIYKHVRNRMVHTWYRAKKFACQVTNGNRTLLPPCSCTFSEPRCCCRRSREPKWPRAWWENSMARVQLSGS